MWGHIFETAFWRLWFLQGFGDSFFPIRLPFPGTRRSSLANTLESIHLSHFYSNPEIVLFNSSRSLADQIKRWSEWNGKCRSLVMIERIQPADCWWNFREDFILVDATGDVAAASDAFLQIVGVLGTDLLAVYTETANEGLETLVRQQGVPLLLGPMSVSEWNEFFASQYPVEVPAAPSVFPRRRLPEREGERGQTSFRPFVA
jgi:hypothetical protein